MHVAMPLVMTELGRLIELDRLIELIEFPPSGDLQDDGIEKIQ